MKNELQKEKKTFYAPLNKGQLNLPVDNVNSIARLRINAITLELRLGSP